MKRDDDYLETGRVAGIVFGITLLWFLLQRRFSALVTLMGLVLSSTAVEGYLVYRGRIPLRVMIPLFCCESLFAIAVLIRDYTNEQRNLRHGAFICLAAAVFVLVSVLSGRQQYYFVKRDQWWQKIYIEGLVEVQEYCHEHPEKKYILDIGAFTYYRGCVLESRLAGEQNCVYSGGWFFNSPIMDDALRSYLYGEEEKICLIAHDNESGEENYTIAFLAEAMRKEAVVIDRFEVSNGAVYLVWGFMGD